MRRHLAVLASVATLVLLAGCGTATTASGPTRPSGSRPADPVVVGLGDSVMTGLSCGCQGIVSGYAELEHARGGSRITPVDLGSNGATTTSLIGELRERSTLNEIRRARAVLLIIGANDLHPQLDQWQEAGCSPACYTPAVTTMGERLGRVLSTIRSERRHSRGTVLVIDYWNVFKDGDEARNEGGQELIDWSRGVSRLANKVICAQSTAYGDRCVDVYGPILAGGKDPTDLLAADGDHPNKAGVELIVRQLVAATPKDVFSPRGPRGRAPA